MFHVTVRINKQKIIAALACIACAGIVIAAIALSLNREQPATSSQASKADNPKPTSFTAADNDARRQFLQNFGWVVSVQPSEVAEITIPAQFDQVYQTYNTLQMQQNLDLSKYCGKRVKRWSYRVLNYPDYPKEVRANLLIYDNSIIGGDICSLEMDGFMHGFAIPQTQQ